MGTIPLPRSTETREWDKWVSEFSRVFTFRRFSQLHVYWSQRYGRADGQAGFEDGPSKKYYMALGLKHVCVSRYVCATLSLSSLPARHFTTAGKTWEKIILISFHNMYFLYLFQVYNGMVRWEGRLLCPNAPAIAKRSNNVVQSF